jgi:DNA-binding NarL/FixJ family response regulator
VRSTAEVATTPVIIFSVLGDKDDVQQGLAAGANDYAVKGFYRPAEIIQKIESALAKSEVKNSLTTYKIGLLPNHLDYILLAQELGLTQGFICPACQEPLVMELTPDVTRETEHWYFAHFVCPKCQTKI